MTAMLDMDTGRNTHMSMQGGGPRPGERRWRRTLRHAGVCFPPPYHPLGASVSVVRAKVAARLSPEAEEFAVLFLRLTPRLQAQPAAMRRQLRKNFWEDWSKLLPRAVVVAAGTRGLDAIDFSDVQRRAQVGRGAAAESAAAECGVALVDGREQAILTHTVEGPSIFVGRWGESSPMLGRLKRRLTPADVVVNVDAAARVPRARAPYAAVPWGSVVHDPHVDWVAAWRDPLLGVLKYAYPAHATAHHQQLDATKYDVAAAANVALPRARVANEAHMRSFARLGGARTDAAEELAQLAACVWVMDALAIRVGTSRGSARGAMTLRVAELRPRGPASLRLDFVGKDRVRYHRDVDGVPACVTRCVALFRDGKADQDRVFDRVTPGGLAAHLRGLAPDLTPRVLRTARANVLLSQCLAKGGGADGTDGSQAAELRLLIAYARVALLCNHRRPVSRVGGAMADADDDPFHDVTLKLDVIERTMTAPKRGDAGTGLRDTRRVISESGLQMGTARTNYLDPRIIVAYCARTALPLERALPAGLRKRFAWAMH